MKRHRKKLDPKASLILDEFARQFKRCWLCGRRSRLHIHHAARGVHRAAARTERCVLIRACEECHEQRLDGMSVAAQMAIKKASDPDGYDLLRFNTIRHRAPSAITEAEVDEWVSRFKATNDGFPYK